MHVGFALLGCRRLGLKRRFCTFAPGLPRGAQTATGGRRGFRAHAPPRRGHVSREREGQAGQRHMLLRLAAGHGGHRSPSQQQANATVRRLDAGNAGTCMPS